MHGISIWKGKARAGEGRKGEIECNNNKHTFVVAEHFASYIDWHTMGVTPNGKWRRRWAQRGFYFQSCIFYSLGSGNDIGSERSMGALIHLFSVRYHLGFSFSLVF